MAHTEHVNAISIVILLPGIAHRVSPLVGVGLHKSTCHLIKAEKNCETLKQNEHEYE